MLQLFPFSAWIALVTSTCLLVILWSVGDLGARQGVALSVWLVVAGYLQFFGESMATVAAGLGAQTVLALYLILYWKLKQW
jgi:hypothetical protein